MIVGSSSGCAGVRSGAPGAASLNPQQAEVGPINFAFRVDASLQRLHARLCFEGAPAAWLKPQANEAWRALKGAWALRGGQREPLTRSGGAIALVGLKAGDCVELEQDLRALASAARGRPDTFAAEGVLALSPDYWLWATSPQSASMRATFEMPEGLGVAVPWPVEGAGAYRIPPSALRWRSHAAFGRFDEATIEVAGGRLRVVILADAWAIGRPRLRAWVQQAAEAAALLDGRFPVDDLLVLITPVGGDEVGFGTVARGGGPSVLLEVGVDIDERELEGDWVAPHELIHLNLPRIDGADPWLYEGFATYYEPVLRARMGDLSPRRAWERLHDGFLRGAGSGTGRALRDESAAMMETYAFWRVYWAGAALMLMADVSLRQAGGDPGSLDAQLGRVRACCQDPDRGWTAEALLEAVAAPDAPDLRAAAGRWLDARRFPDLGATYEALGLRFDAGGRLLTRPGDPGAALRIAIMGRDVDEAP